MRRVACIAVWSVLGCTSEPAASSSDATTEVATTSTGTSTGTTGAASSGGAADSSSSTGGEAPACNGAPELCARTYDAVVFPATHNSFAATEAGFISAAANQTKPIADQLEDGIRVLLLDVHPDGDHLSLCHSDCAFGSIPHRDALAELDAFLAAHPRDVLTIIYEDAADEADIVADIEASGLVARAYIHDGGPWPTLGEMIDAGTTLVITAENGGPPPPWYHHVWDEAWDTKYTWSSIAEFDCEPNRGDPSHALFLLNHWISNAVGLPDYGAADEANAYGTLLAHAQACPRLPTFVAVDFYDHGDLFAVVATLNGLD